MGGSTREQVPWISGDDLVLVPNKATHSELCTVKVSRLMLVVMMVSRTQSIGASYSTGRHKYIFVAWDSARRIRLPVSFPAIVRQPQPPRLPFSLCINRLLDSPNDYNLIC